MNNNFLIIWFNYKLRLLKNIWYFIILFEIIISNCAVTNKNNILVIEMIE